jgi:hypothetical protein
METLEFDDIALKVIKVKMGGKKYLLREPNALDGCAHRNALINQARRNEAGEVVSMDAYSELELDLLALCFFENAQTEEEGPPIFGNAVPREFICGLPDRVSTKLYDALKGITKTIDVAKVADPT